MRAHIQSSAAIAIAVIGLAVDGHAAACTPTNWLTRNNLYCYTPALRENGCVVSINHSVDNNSYTKYDDLANFWQMYRGSCSHWPSTGKGTIASDGNTTVPVTLYWGTDHAWPSALDQGAVGQLNFQYGATSGAMNPRSWYASIRVDWLRPQGEVAPYNDSRYNIAGTIMHECLHALGLGDHNEGVMAPFSITYGAGTPTTTDIADITCVYSSPVCVEEYSPVLFADLRCERLPSGCARLTITTHREDAARQLRILHAEAPPASYEDYELAGTIPLSSPNGGTYEWTDFSAQAWDYAVEVEENDGGISEVLFIRKSGTEIYSYGYPPGTIEAIRSANASRIQLPYWKGVSSGATVPPAISAAPASCDVLIVAYRDFARDLAPICDYWQGQGYRVRLVTCEASDSFSGVRACIIGHDAMHALDGVWLVGASAGTPSYSGYYQLVPSEDDSYDFRYGDINDDGDLEVPLGRLPAASRDQVAAYVNRELQYHRDTLWGGRKPKSRYGEIQVNIVPANHASNGDRYAWSPGQYSVGAAGTDVYNSLAAQLGGDRVHGFLSTQTFEWQFGDDATYADAVWTQVSSDLALGRHVIFGVSYHNSEAAQYAVIAGNRWRGRTTDPVEEFWIAPECYSNSYSAQGRINPEEPTSMPSYLIPVYELFVGQALAIVGSSGVASHNVTGSVVRKWADRMFVEDAELGHCRPLGRLLRDIVNDVRDEYTVTPEGLCNYCVFGDPMLYVRGLYDDAVVGVEAGQEAAKPTLTMSPNPGNGRVVLRIGNVSNEQVRVDLFDIAGRKVWGAVEKAGPQSDRTVVWGGMDRNGRTVASGKYLVRVAAGREVLRGTIVYVK
jgi:hypothetical protein